MQNKANFKKAEMNVSSISIRDYENKCLRGRKKNKAKQSQFQNRRQETEVYLPEVALTSCHKSSVSCLIPEPVTAEMA